MRKNSIRVEGGDYNSYCTICSRDGVRSKLNEIFNVMNPKNIKVAEIQETNQSACSKVMFDTTYWSWGFAIVDSP